VQHAAKERSMGTDAGPDLEANVQAYLSAIERGDREALVALLHPAAEQIELPNRLKAKGDRRTLEAMARDFERGKTILRRQSYEIVAILRQDSNVAVRVLWRGELAIPLGSLKAGDAMTAHSAIFFEFEDGLIRRQFNYDCFEAF
jgi:ketosteroid isomerase-like protein